MTTKLKFHWQNCCLLNDHFKIHHFYSVVIRNLPQDTVVLDLDSTALAISKAYSHINSLSCSVRELSNIIKRGNRSGIGIAV